MAPRETENNACAKFGVTNKEQYGMLWYFLERSIGMSQFGVQSSLGANDPALRKPGHQLGFLGRHADFLRELDFVSGMPGFRF